MRIPDGRQCEFYYEDYHRIAGMQECRIHKDPRSAQWNVEACSRCPVPDILLANGSPWLELTLRIRRLPLMQPKMLVSARCTKHGIPVPDPYAGCSRDFEDLPEL